MLNDKRAELEAFMKGNLGRAFKAKVLGEQFKIHPSTTVGWLYQMGAKKEGSSHSTTWTLHEGARHRSPKTYTKPSLGANGSKPVSPPTSVAIALRIAGKTHEMDLVEAEDLYNALRTMFNK